MAEALETWQARVGAWTVATFGEGCVRETLQHMAEEMRELIEADTSEGHVAKEAADVLILLLCYAHRKVSRWLRRSLVNTPSISSASGVQTLRG